MAKMVMLDLFFSDECKVKKTEFTFDNTKGLTDSVVTNVEGKTAPEIYKKVIDWIKITYKNPDKVILSTIENEYVKFEVFSSACYSNSIPLMGKSFQDIKYQIEVSINDGKYKFDIVGIEDYIPTSKNSKGGRNNEVFNSNLDKEYLDKYIYKKDGTLISNSKNSYDVPAYFSDLNKSLLESITDYVSKNEGW